MSQKKDPLTIPLAEFRALPPEESEALRQEVIKLSTKLIQRFLIDGENYWILVCGDTRAIMAAARTATQVYPDEEIAKFEERMGVPAYNICRHEVISKEG